LLQATQTGSRLCPKDTIFSIQRTDTLALPRDESRQRKVRLNRNQYEERKRTGLPLPKEILAEHIERSLEASGGSEERFFQLLRRQGIVSEVVERSNGRKGLRFIIQGQSIKASSLGKQYSYKALQGSLEALREEELDPGAPNPKTRIRINNEMIEAVALDQEIGSEEKQAPEDKEAKRTTLERLERLRIRCPREIEFDVEFTYGLVSMRLFRKRFYLFVLLHVAELEQDYEKLHRIRQEKMRQYQWTDQTDGYRAVPR
jgi:hypothetical protein